MPSKPSTPTSDTSPIVERSRAGITVAKLRQQYDDSSSLARSTVVPLTTSNLANLSQNEYNPPVVRAKITAAAAPRRKIGLPGAERAEPPPAKTPLQPRPASVLAKSAPAPAYLRPALKVASSDEHTAPPQTYSSETQHTPTLDAEEWDPVPSSSSKDTVLVCVR